MSAISISFRQTILAGLVFAFASVVQAQWPSTEIDGREYVALEDLATYFGMTPPVQSGGEFSIAGGGRSLNIRPGGRQALIDGVRHWLSFPAVVKNGSTYLAKQDVLKSVDPALRPTEIKGLRPVTTVVLDPGHGGHDRGASGPYGFEKEFTLDVAARVRKRLEKAGLKVVTTRLSDVFLSLEARPARANKIPNSVFVSIHFNSTGANPAASGIEVFALSPLGAPPTGQKLPQARDSRREPGHASEPASFALTTAMQHALLGGTSGYDRGVKRARFVVLKNATVPAVLIEGGFVTNAAEAARIASPQWRESLAAAIVTGILEYKALAEKKAVPRRVSDFGRASTTDFVPEN